MVKQIKGQYKVNSPTLKDLHQRARTLIDQLEGFEIRHVLRAENRKADGLANMAMDRGMGKKVPTVSATEVGGTAAVATTELTGIVSNGVVQFTGDPLPEGTLVKIRAVKP
jgi:hypothetical protein